ncbi:MAG TPA: phosphotransferase [Tepidiformaceae bacterium]|nr:phosphotransferase [Tepidiformaceae bacterium]
MASPAVPAIPGGINELTAEWIEMALQRTAPGSRIASITMQRVGEGVGFLGELTRVSITYAQNPADAGPSSVIVKLPTNMPEPRAIAAGMGFYEREVGFYREFSEQAGPRVPRCYYVEYEPATQAFVLVLEDFPEAAAGDQLASCTEEQAKLAVRELAKLHARWWESDALARYDWLHKEGHVFIQILKGAHLQFLPVFEEHWAHKFDPMVGRVARALGERYDQYIEMLMSMRATLAHQDYRLDNVLFGPPGTSEEIVVLDWQLVQKNTGLTDLQYFIAGNLRSDVRKKMTDDLVRLYHDGLCEGGVRDYSLAQCKDDFVRASSVLGFYVVTGVANIDPNNYDERGHDVIELLYGSLADAIVEYEAERWIP